MFTIPHSVQIGDVMFNGKHQPSPFWGVEHNPAYAVTALEGWYSIPALRGSPDARPGADGTFERTSWWRDSPAISVTVVAYDKDPTYTEVARLDLLQRLMSASVMRVTDHTGMWERHVSVVEVKQDSSLQYGTLGFTIDLETYDVARYSTFPVSKTIRITLDRSGLMFPAPFLWSFGSATTNYVLVMNNGMVPAYPTVTLSGGTADVAMVTDVTANRRLAARVDGVILFDARERQMFRDGVDQTKTAVSREWFMIPPGETHRFELHAENPTDGLQATIRFNELNRIIERGFNVLPQPLKERHKPVPNALRTGDNVVP